MTTLESNKSLRLYQQRMKIEVALRDLTSLLCMGMIKRHDHMEKLLALLLLSMS